MDTQAIQTTHAMPVTTAFELPTRCLMRVWVDPPDGSRHDVADRGPPPAV